MFKYLVCMVALLSFGGSVQAAKTQRTTFPGADWAVATPQSRGVDAAKLDRISGGRCPE